MPTHADLLVLNASELVTCADGPEGPLRGDDLRAPGMLENAGVAITDGRIAAVGTTKDIATRFAAPRTIDAQDCAVLPGFVDPHTHLVFGRTREDEFELRCLGKTYEEIAAAGGGIRASSRRFRATSRAEIFAQARATRRRALLHGTTTIEIKSGYGLDLASELLALEIAGELDDNGDVVRTFLGAHEVPDAYRDDRDAYIRLVCDEMIPTVASRGLARYCDVFCEEHVFTQAETRTICRVARENGLEIKLHVDELAGTGGAELAVELRATSADHLMQISAAGIAAMAASDTIAVLLPGTSFFLGMQTFAPARRMIQAGCAIALATDCNPGSSMSENPQTLLTIACIGLGLRPIEAIAALTRNAAYAVDLGTQVGRIAPGYRADLIVTDVANHRLVPYHHGVNHAATVIHHGRIVA